MFSARKVGQMAAYFARRQGGQINILKLMKLLYLADRESMAQHGSPISFDKFVAMDHGPVLSRTLNLINGTYPEQIAADWDEWISDRENHQIACNRDFSRDDLDQLSDADLDVLNVVWREFGHMNQWDLRDYTHQHITEWTNPNGSSLPIREVDILRAVGVSQTEAERLAEEIRAEHQIDRAFGH
jgi:uncharacterized phage-associated protein